MAGEIGKLKRRKSRLLKIGRVKIGAGHPVAIQSMLKVASCDVQEAIAQVRELEACGCEIVRLAIRDKSDAKALKEIKRRVNLPLVADIHFDFRLALQAIESGADKIRLNPGNIYKPAQVAAVVSALKQAKIPLRVGVNSGSLRGLRQGRASTADNLVSSALGYIRMIEKLKFYNLAVSLKAANVRDTIYAYRKISRLCDYPLHLGVTATGFPFAGLVKSSIALGALLLEGIGDTLRVSLTDTPQKEVQAAKAVLEALGLRCFGPEVISCPTCGRCEVDLIKIVNDLENKLSFRRYPLSAKKPVKLAVMGCVVNGPGEAKEADIGAAFGKGGGLLFKKGKPFKKVTQDNCVKLFLKEADNYIKAN